MLTAVAVLCSSGLAAASAPAASSPSGDQAAIKFVRASQVAMGGFEGISFRGSGTSYKILHERGFDNFEFNFGATPRGYASAVDDVVVVQRHGRVTEEVDTLIARGMPAVRLWRSATNGTLVGKVQDSRACAVYFTNNWDGFVSVGAPFVVLGGHQFAPLQATKRGDEVVRTTYVAGGGTGHETDTINATSGLWKHSVYRQRGGPYNGYSLSESAFTFRHRQQFVAPAQLGRCP